ncbi:hypothetical protein ACWFNE_15060 [Cellulomonas sp. NPDC055163]
MPQSVTFASHVAHLDPMTGYGVLVRPDPSRDLADPMRPGLSLHSADWDAALLRLDALGWEPLGDEWDVPTWEGSTADGREVVALYGRTPVIGRPTPAELSEARAALCVLAGVEA